MLWFISTKKPKAEKSTYFANPIATSRFDVKKNLTGLYIFFVM
jgi:hypothetical protein